MRQSHSHRRVAVLLRAGWLGSLAAGFALVSGGCGQDGPARNRVSGNITFAGQSVPSGQITFEPDSAAGNKGPQGSAPINAGRYDTGAKGTVGGAHLVRITGFDRPPGGALAPKPLFNAYEMKVDLGRGTVTKDFDVPAEAANGLQISSEPPP